MIFLQLYVHAVFIFQTRKIRTGYGFLRTASRPIRMQDCAKHNKFQNLGAWSGQKNNIGDKKKTPISVSMSFVLYACYFVIAFIKVNYNCCTNMDS